MQRDCALNVSFGSADIDGAVFNVHILTVEPAEFVGTCPSAVLQPEEDRELRRPDIRGGTLRNNLPSGSRGQLIYGPEEVADLFVSHQHRLNPARLRAVKMEAERTASSVIDKAKELVQVCGAVAVGFLILGGTFCPPEIQHFLPKIWIVGICPVTPVKEAGDEVVRPGLVTVCLAVVQIIGVPFSAGQLLIHRCIVYGLPDMVQCSRRRLSAVPCSMTYSREMWSD